MSSTLLPVLSAPTQITAIRRAQEGALILLRRAGTGVPRTGTVKLASEPGARGLLHATAWLLAEGQARTSSPPSTSPTMSTRSTAPPYLLRGAHAADRDMPVTLPPALGATEFGHVA